MVQLDNNILRQTDPKTPGIVKSTKTVNVTNMLGFSTPTAIQMDSVIMYMDNNIQLRAACATVPNFWVGKQYLYYFILVTII